MRLLLDTSTFILWHAGRLRPPAIRTMRRAELVVVSAVTAWEIAIKRAIGKLRLDTLVEDIVAQNGFLGLPVTLHHGDLLRELPLHHPDPFDRLLIVQALEEGLTILTSDRAFEPYRVPVVWA